MIKIAVFNLGRGMYSVFSLNQEYPVATVLKAPGASKEEIERILIVRFHSQRNEYKKQGKYIEPINQNGKRRGGWKFIWYPLDVLFNKTQKTEKVETLVSEPGLTITKKSPFVEQMEKTLFDKNEITGSPIKEQFVMAEQTLDGKFTFTPLTDDIIFLTQIPEYITKHSGKKDA